MKMELIFIELVVNYMHKNKFKKEALNDCLKILGGAIVFSAFCDSIVIWVQIILAKSLGSFTNSIVAGEYHLVTKNLWVISILILINIALEPFNKFIQSTLLFKQALKHHSEVVSRFLNKDYLKAKEYGAGELSSRWDIDLLNYRTSIIRIISKPIIILLSSIPISIYFFNNFKYSAVCLIAALIPVITTYFTSALQSFYYIKNSEYEAEKRDYEINLATGHTYLKINNISDLFISKLDIGFKNFFSVVGIKTINLKNSISFLNAISNYISQIIVIIFGLSLLSNGDILIGDIASYLAYLIPVQSIIKELSIFIKEIKVYRKFSNRIIEFYTDCENLNGKNVDEAINEISLKSVSFFYNKENPTFENISFSLKKGMKLLIHGSNGSGKSTLVKIIGGLYSKYEGNLTVNGIDYKDLNIYSFRKRVSYIDQMPYFFKGTLEENIKIVNPEATLKQVQELMTQLKINKPLDYLIKDDGSNLSGGEKQKISLLRGLLKSADLYIIDEPTNNLDMDTKEVIKSILKDKKYTVIFITHYVDLQSIADEKILI
jgi:ABC-type bacteriocin/lantibiotic exporter with double-glycine peptidase domain